MYETPLIEPARAMVRRVTYKKARWAYSLPTIDNPQIRTNVQQV